MSQKPLARRSLTPIMPDIARMSLQRQSGTLYAGVMQRARELVGESLDDPGQICEYHDRESGLVIIQFANSNDIEQLYRTSGGDLLIELDDD